MRKRIRVCGKQCHKAKGTKCRCWCLSLYHGADGAANREAVAHGYTDASEAPGFNPETTKYLGQRSLQLAGSHE